MCTVVVRWSPGEPARLLALRDELTDRPFDDPGEWWPDHPGVVGGRDRTAGGTWCASDVATGVSALVLNRPEKRVAAPGAPSRGVLPLLAVRHEHNWPDELQLSGMASFALVLVTDRNLTVWLFDGERLTSSQLEPGTHMVTSGGAEDGKADRYLADFAADPSAQAWRRLVVGRQPADDPAALVVRHALEASVYATVFGQVIEARPGRVALAWSRTPWAEGSWQSQLLS